MSKPEVIVSLTPDQEKLFRAFQKSEQEAKKMADGIEKSGSSIDRALDTAVKALQKTDTTGKKVFTGLSDHMSKFSINGRKSVDEVLKEIGKLDSSLEDQGRKILAEFHKVDEAKKFSKTTRQLEALGGRYAKMAKHIREAVDVGGDAGKHAMKLVSELEKMDPRAAEGIRRAMKEAREETEKARYDELVSLLGKGGAEARKLATIIGEDIKAASIEAEGGIDGIISKISKLDPKLKESVSRWKSEMAEAAKFGEGKYEKALDALRKGGPVAAEVAKKIKRELVEAGEIVEETFEDMVKPLERINPQLAAQALLWKEELDEFNKKGQSVFSVFSEHAMGQIAAIAGAYAGFHETVDFVADKLQKQQEMFDRASGAHRSLAKEQEGAILKLQGVDEATKKDLLETFVPQVAKDKAFPDLLALTAAVGDTYSAGATVGQIKDYLPVAASLTPNSPENIGTFTAAMADASRATGIQSGEKLSNMLLNVGSLARITESDKTFRNVAPVLVASATGAAAGEEQLDALQGAAVFTGLTRAGADPTGDSSQTATIQLRARMRGFFANLGKDATSAKAELAALKDPISERSRLRLKELSDKQFRKKQTDNEIRATQDRLSEIEKRERAGGLDAEEKRQLGYEKSDLKKKLSSLHRMEFSDREAAELADLQDKVRNQGEGYTKKRNELLGKIAAADVKGFKGRAPTLFLDQFQAFHKNPGLQDAFLAEAFGEQRYRAPIEAMVRGGAIFGSVQNAYGQIKGSVDDTSQYHSTVDAINNGTNALQQAHFQRMDEAGKNIQDAFDTAAAQKGGARNEGIGALGDARSEGFDGILQSLDELGIATGFNLTAQSSAEEITQLVGHLTKRIKAIKKDGVTEQEKPKLERAKSVASNLIERLGARTTAETSSREELTRLARRAEQRAQFESGVTVSSPYGGGATIGPVLETDPEVKAIFNSLHDTLEKILKVQEETRDNTKGRPGDKATAGALGGRR